MLIETPQKRATTGSVGVEEKAGKLRLRLPNTVVQGSSRYISTRLDDTPENFKRVQRLAWDIEEDIKAGNFDPTLGRYKPQSHLTVVKATKTLDLSALWDLYSEYRKPQIAETTYRKEYVNKYRNHIAKLPTKDLSQAVLIRDHLTANLTPNAAKRVLTYLSACCEWSVESGHITKNPFQGMSEKIKLPNRDTETIDPFSAEERDAILEAFKSHKSYSWAYCFVRFLFLTGCRTGEAIGLKWGHITKDCSMITFCESYDSQLKITKDTKTHRTRKFPCNPALKGMLLEIRPGSADPEAYVFTSPTGLPISNTRFTNQVWKGCRSGHKVYKGIVTQLVKEGKVERYRCLYNTRHTFATMALEAGVTVSQVAKLIGNSPEITLRHYAGSTLKIEVPVF